MSRKKVILSKEQEEYIISSYNNFIPISTIVENIGYNKRIIYNTLDKYKIPRHGEKRVLSEEQRRDVIEKYLDGKSQQEIANYYSVNRWTIQNILKENNIEFRDRGELIRKYDVDENYFDHIDNAEKAYIIGLLWSDGCNKTDRGCISLKLQDTDKHILEDIKKLMGSNQPLYFSPRKQDSHHDTYSLEISSVKLSKRLEELGMIASKSLSLEFPKWLDESLYSSFILGLIDGDGCISTNNYSVSLVGTSYLLEEIKKIFSDVLQIDCHIYSYNKNNITKTLFVSRKDNVMKLLNWIYSSSSSIHLKRKYELYKLKCDKYYGNINNSQIA